MTYKIHQICDRRLLSAHRVPLEYLFWQFTKHVSSSKLESLILKTLPGAKNAKILTPGSIF